VYLAWGEILSSGPFCAIAQFLGAPQNAPIALANFASEGRRDLFLGSIDAENICLYTPV